MPELPEVETMVRGVRPHLTGSLITDVITCKNACKPIQISPGIGKIRDRLFGRKITSVRRLGKRVVIDSEDGASLVFEPRMTGLVLLSDPPDIEHLRVKITFSGDSTYDAVWFWDRRGLGTMRLYEPGELDRELGPDNLGKDALVMTADDWKNCCATTGREIKIVLLDQKRVAGIGNLYASEILHLAGINPLAAANCLRPKEIRQLSSAVLKVLKKAVECEGSTLGDGTYRNALNQSGRYQNEHRVYMRAGEICLVCEKSTILRVVQGQRSTFFCPTCQKNPPQ